MTPLNRRILILLPLFVVLALLKNPQSFYFSTAKSTRTGNTVGDKINSFTMNISFDFDNFIHTEIMNSGNILLDARVENSNPFITRSGKLWIINARPTCHIMGTSGYTIGTHHYTISMAIYGNASKSEVITKYHNYIIEQIKNTVL